MHRHRTPGAGEHLYRVRGVENWNGLLAARVSQPVSSVDSASSSGEGGRWVQCALVQDEAKPAALDIACAPDTTGRGEVE